MSLDDDSEKKLRKLAKERYNNRKGSMAKIVAEGIRKIESTNDPAISESTRQMLALMDKGFRLGRRLYKDRSELYER